MASLSSAIVPVGPAKAEGAAAGPMPGFVSPSELLKVVNSFTLGDINANKTPGGLKLHGSNVFLNGPRKIAVRVVVRKAPVPAGMVDAKTPTGLKVITKLNDYDALQLGFQIVDVALLPVLDAIRVRISELVFERRADILGDAADLFSSSDMILQHLMKKASYYKMGGLGRNQPMLYAKAKGWASTFEWVDVESYKGGGRGYTNAVYVPRPLSASVAKAAVFALNLYNEDGVLLDKSAVSVAWREDDALASTAPIRRDPETHAPLRRRVGPQDVTELSTGTAYLDLWGINVDDKHVISLCVNLVRLNFDPAEPGAKMSERESEYDLDAEFDDTDAYVDMMAARRASALSALKDAAAAEEASQAASQAAGEAFIAASQGRAPLPASLVSDDDELDAAAAAAIELGMKRARDAAASSSAGGGASSEHKKKHKSAHKNTFNVGSVPRT